MILENAARTTVEVGLYSRTARGSSCGEELVGTRLIRAGELVHCDWVDPKRPEDEDAFLDRLQVCLQPIPSFRKVNGESITSIIYCCAGR